MRLTPACTVALLLISLRIVCQAAQYVYDANNQLVKATYSAGREVSYAYDPAGNLLSISVSNVVSPPLLALNQDVGSPTAPGGSGYTNGIYSVKGAGDISGVADAFQFVYRSLTGDGEIIAQVTGLSDPNASGLAKAGIMMREDLSAGSRYALVDLTSSNAAAFQSRASASGPSTVVTSPEAVPPPCWLKLVRQGTTFTGYRSANGTTWAAIGSTSIALPNLVYVGLAVSSHDAAVLSTAAFSSVQVMQAASAQNFSLNVRLLSSTQVELMWNTVTNWNYQVQFCPGLASPGGTNLWQVLGSGVSGSGSPASATDSFSPASQTPRYYRVVATPSP